MNKCLTFCFYPLFFILVCFLLPDDILDKSSALNKLVEFFKNYINALNNFELNARYADQFQVSFLLAILLIPLQSYFMENSNQLEGVKEKINENAIFNFIMLSIIILIFIFYTFFWYGSNVDGSGKFSRSMRSIMSNKVYYSLFSSGLFILLGAFFAALLIHIKNLIKKILK